MKAVVIDKYGSSDEFENRNMDRPQIRPNEVLIKEDGFGFNPADIQMRQDTLDDKFIQPAALENLDQWRMPLILGADVVGEIVEVGSEVNDFHVGDVVAADAEISGRGTYAEYAPVEADKVALKPDNVSTKEAAALPLAGITAYQMLNDDLKIQSGEKLLIQGGAGGVGHLAIQIAKNMGAHVVVTASSNHAELMKKLGADQVIDYHESTPSSVISNYDATLDTVGEVDNGLSVLKPEGRFDTIIGSPDQEQKTRVDQVMTTQTRSNGKTLAYLLNMIKEDKIHPVISRSLGFSADNVKSAHNQLESHHTTGKIVAELNK